MKLGHVLLNATTAVTGLCAVIVTVHVIRNSAVASGSGNSARNPVPVENWQSLASTGHRIGPLGAKLTVIEFGDFQCPACGAYEHTLDSMRQRHPGDFAIVFHEFPLAYHPLAYPLAKAAECAAVQDRFVAFHDTVYAEQEELGVIPVLEFAARAGIRDTARFRECVLNTRPVRDIDRDLRAGRRLGVPGTPALIVDGIMHTSDLGVKDLERILARH